MLPAEAIALAVRNKLQTKAGSSKPPSEGGDLVHSVTAAESAASATATVTPSAVFEPRGSAPPETAPLLVSSALHSLLADPRVLPLGGSLIFHCEHRYPHTAVELAGRSDLLSQHLKGRDAAVLAAAQACGVPVALLPLLSDDTDILYSSSPEEYAASQHRRVLSTALHIAECKGDFAPYDPTTAKSMKLWATTLRGDVDSGELARKAARCADEERGVPDWLLEWYAEHGRIVPEDAGEEWWALAVALSEVPEREAVRALIAAGVEFGSSALYGALSELHPPVCGCHVADDREAIVVGAMGLLGGGPRASPLCRGPSLS